MSTTTLANPAPTDAAPPEPPSFTITEWYFVWSTESWFLGLILYINTATVFGSLWLNWTSRMQLGQCWTLAAISASAFVNIILTSVRTTIDMSEYARIQAMGIAQSVIEWVEILGVLYLNYTRVVAQFDGSGGIKWSPNIARALKAGVVTSGVFATVVYGMYIAAYARGETTFAVLDSVYAWSGIYDALVHASLSLSLAYFFKRTLESSPSLQPAAGGKMSRAQAKATRLIRSTQMFLVLENLPIVLFNVVRLVAPEFDPQWSLVYFFETLRLRFFLASFVTLFELDKLVNWQASAGGTSTGEGSSTQDTLATKSTIPDSTLTIPVPQKSVVASP